MKYLCETGTLHADDGRFLKQLACPLHKAWNELQILEIQDPITHEPIELKRHCASCKKDVINITGFDDAQVDALLKVDPNTCVYASANSQYIEFIGSNNRRCHAPSPHDPSALIIRTARTVAGINSAASEGLWPLIKRTEQSKDIKQKIIVSQKDDGSIETSNDYRSGLVGSFVIPMEGNSDIETVSENRSKLVAGSFIFSHNSYTSPLPFAAYLIPKDLEPGSQVFVADVIEDVVNIRWNQGDSYRKRWGDAVWDGNDLILEQTEVGEICG